MSLKAPFPWFGGKRKVATEVWPRFGQVKNYVEPFAGSLAVLLGRPHDPAIETVNDLDGFVANFWRSIIHDPEGVVDHALWPVHESELHARHAWLIERRDRLTAHLEGSPDYYDARIAGYWVWGISAWIGSGWCRGNGPWRVVNGQLVNKPGKGPGINRGMPTLSNAGQGILRQFPQAGKASRISARGDRENMLAYLRCLQERLAQVRVCCGDWLRIMGSSATHYHGTTGIFLDPPYSAEAGRCEVYTQEDLTVAHAVRAWCLREGHHPLLRIALCGYEGEGHEVLEDQGWSVYAWNAGSGYGGMAKERTGNGRRERIWFSPACINPTLELFAAS
mgnify:CR=1 FL=1